MQLQVWKGIYDESTAALFKSSALDRLGKSKLNERFTEI